MLGANLGLLLYRKVSVMNIQIGDVWKEHRLFVYLERHVAVFCFCARYFFFISLYFYLNNRPPNMSVQAKTCLCDCYYTTIKMGFRQCMYLL